MLACLGATLLYLLRFRIKFCESEFCFRFHLQFAVWLEQHSSDSLILLGPRLIFYHRTLQYIYCHSYTTKSGEKDCSGYKSPIEKKSSIGQTGKGLVNVNRCGLWRSKFKFWCLWTRRVCAMCCVWSFWGCYGGDPRKMHLGKYLMCARCRLVVFVLGTNPGSDLPPPPWHPVERIKNNNEENLNEQTSETKRYWGRKRRFGTPSLKFPAGTLKPWVGPPTNSWIRVDVHTSLSCFVKLACFPSATLGKTLGAFCTRVFHQCNVKSRDMYEDLQEAYVFTENEEVHVFRRRKCVSEQRVLVKLAALRLNPQQRSK